MKKAEDTQFPLKKNPKSKTGGSHNFLFFNLLFCNRDIQFSAAFTGRIYGHVGALGWTWGRSLPFWEAQQERGSDCSPSLILSQCCEIQPRAGRSPPAQPCTLIKAHKWISALQTWVWSPGNPRTGCVCLRLLVLQKDCTKATHSSWLCQDTLMESLRAIMDLSSSATVQTKSVNNSISGFTV